MALEAGTRLGAFEITGSLGAGGMGEVYRATDTKLGREVAIKTLPSALAGDADRLARFEREAKLLAALNHAHIAAVYGLDEHEGTQYLAMELVEGETLERKLKAGPLPLDDALQIALQIAEALEAAHDKGVVHRDLKPANVMITREGQVKVLDFGLAKAFSGNPSEASPAHSPALSMAMTQQGLVLGTAGYMSPEQASGQATDQRADIWAFGVVLYEMLTGLPLFSGESVPHILADVLKTEPDWSRLPEPLHPRLKLMLERCLTKKPRDRYHSIADVRVDLEKVLDDPQGAAAAIAADTGGPSRPRRPRLAAVAGIAAVLGAAVTALVGWRVWPAATLSTEPVVRFSIPLPEGQSFTLLAARAIAISPDGTRIAYVANNQIYLRNLNQTEARPVPGTAEPGGGAAMPVFSPDGQWLAYVSILSVAGPYVIKRVPISGGTAVSIHEAKGNLRNLPQGLTWPTPDTMLFTDDEGIVRVPANGGATEVLVPRGQDERFFSPQLLPGGKTVLFTRLSGEPGAAGGIQGGQVVVQSIGGNDRKVVWDGGSAARYLPSGHLVYAQGAALFAIPFDPDTRAVRGGPVPMVQGVRRANAPAVTDGTDAVISDTGTLALIPAAPDAGNGTRIETTPVWVDRDGNEAPLPVRPDDYTAARISPDRKKIALVVGNVFQTQDRPPHIWVFDLTTGNLSLLTGDTTADGPVWSSDGSRIFFRTMREDAPGIYAVEVATGEVTLVGAQTPDVPFPLGWSISPDDKTLALISATSGADIHVAALSLEDGKFASLLHGEEIEMEPSISPNGAWLAYQQGVGVDSAGFEIDIRPFPDVARTRIPVGPGQSPVFSRDGSELFFLDGSGSLAVASVAYEPTLRVGAPRKLFDVDSYQAGDVGRAWDIDPAGKRFLMIPAPDAPAAGAPAPRPQIDVVVNWFGELKTRVPTE